ncbi:sigma-70 family RNA polymerase sigma factor [Pseudoflavonifractor sp. 524-17]|uniref:sigma-70 family RNA polymerase sigma factor n=1 Tax=Pseudoflavonifractor sp. 524-17 TaxID=2304577 RepID=UPI00137A4035|nr:sigma-70 family RNA polymerase sigma factor [Pseudoflavonifractor sp. 524-17]NCE66283.1 sigma-70 family RNA polymerase sigma factor [Pseudoflavonifractor sp. 524-17]
MTRFEQFNEMMFEAYCKKAVSNAAKKERQKKAARGLMEQSLSKLTDATLYGVVAESGEVEQPEEPCQIFYVQEMNIPVYEPELSKALSYLMPKDREIILLYYFKGLKDAKIALLVHMGVSTVSRRRRAATKRLRELIENAT